MKTINFFIEKSSSFIKTLESIELGEYKIGKPLGNIYGEVEHVDNSEYNNQTKELSDIHFEMKLMLSEFDNSDLLMVKLNDFDIKPKVNNASYLKHLIDFNKYFINFLIEYRID